VINGTIEVTSTAAFIGPDFTVVQADPAALYKTVNLGTDGKVVLKEGATFTLGNSPTAPNLVGASPATYTWTSTNNDAEIEINSGGLIIRDINDIATPVQITIEAPGAGILSNQSLRLERGVTLTVDTAQEFYLFGHADGGAKLLGPGTLAAGPVTFTGSDAGWQAFTNDVAITTVSATRANIYPISLDTTVTAPETTLKALGSGAVISVSAGGTLSLGITGRTKTTIDLNGTPGLKKGEIRLAVGAIINFTSADGKIFTIAPVPTTLVSASLSTNDNTAVAVAPGPPPVYSPPTLLGVTALYGVGTPLVGVQAATSAAFEAARGLPAGILVSLIGGTGTDQTATATGADVPINSETPTDANP
jgi:hypothetical protein